MSDERVAAVLERLYAEDAAQRAANLPSSQRTRNVDRETGRWLGLVVRATKARVVLEIGSSNGVSTIWLATAARENGGQVTGTEILPERAAAANRNLAAAGLERVAHVVAGAARETVASLPGPFDLVFIDADKPRYHDYYEVVLPKLAGRGLILADNVISHDLSDYQALLGTRGDVETVTVPIGRGIEFTLKTA